jgi:hypothetical protein
MDGAEPPFQLAFLNYFFIFEDDFSAEPAETLAFAVP